MSTNQETKPLFNNSPWLAPLAGYSDLPFRLLCRECGCGTACTEMISAKGLVYDSKSTWKYLNTCTEDSPLVVQLFGGEPHFLYKAVKMLQEKGFSYFDLNAGCPVKKVVKTGSGAALLKDPQNLQDCLLAMLQASGERNVGVKIRSGWSPSLPNYLEVGKKVEESGAAWVTLHPRFATKGYSVSSNWSHLYELENHLAVPVLGSGDLLSAREGVKCMEQTGISNIMFARGALKDPLVFEKYRLARVGSLADRSCGPSDSAWDFREQAGLVCTGAIANQDDADVIREKQQLIKRHMDLACRFEDEKRAFLKMRTLIPRYLNGFYRVGEIRKRVIEATSWRELLGLLDDLGEWLQDRPGIQ
ncbi:MAG: tRNA dihydrouridine synthase [Thermodesulfobacteriota bacterium]